jgi:hypothetical protein
MKNSILIFLLIAATAIACSKKKIEKTTALDKETTTVKKETIPEIKTPNKTEPKTDNIRHDINTNLVAKINRTPCYGKCPVFTIELYNNGLVKYNGVAFVEKKGSFTAKANQEFMKQIQDKALSIKYLSLENKYPIAPITIADLPITTTYIRIGDAGKQIIDNFDAPRELIDFENWLEQEFDKLVWKAE